MQWEELLNEKVSLAYSKLVKRGYDINSAIGGTGWCQRIPVCCSVECMGAGECVYF